jgi:hypothetical protein
MKIRRLLMIGTALATAALPMLITGTASASSSTQVIRDYATGRCLDSNSSGNVYTLPCNGGNYQNWRVNGYTIVDNQTGRCLDSNGSGNVYTLPCNGGNYQNWLPENVLLSGNSYGLFYIDFATNRCLDSNGNGNVYTLACNGGHYQDWVVGAA